MKLKIDNGKCKACALCIRACPKQLLILGETMNAGGYKYVVFQNEEACISCANCAISCPDRAISVYKEEKGA
jgi:2-oxoglutarate ferredoxin oxidoreductase subunit delta